MFYKNKIITFIVPYTPGGGFDTYVRLVAPFFQKYIPGSTVIVENKTGAGGVIGTNEIFLAKPDGLTIGIVNVPGMVFNQVGGSEGVNYDLEKFSWIGRITSEPHVLAMGSQGDIKSVEDLKKVTNTIKIGLTGVGSDDYFASIVLFDSLGIPMKTIPGYGGQAEATLAVLRGEVEGTQATYSSLKSSLDSGDLIPILQLAIGDDAIEGIPLAKDILEEEKATLIKAITNIFTLDRSFAVPPGVPEERIQLLRDSMWKALNDPEFLATCEQANRYISALDGETVQN